MTDTSAPKYKEAIELMASEIEICVDKEDDPLRKVFILGQGDYPTGYQIVESTADEIRKLRRALSDETAKTVALTAERDALKSVLQEIVEIDEKAWSLRQESDGIRKAARLAADALEGPTP